MSYVLDTDILVFVLRGNESLRVKFDSFSDRDLHSTIITHAELMFGAFNSARRQKNIEETRILLNRVHILPFDEASSYLYAEIKAELRADGNIIPDMDLMIAAICLKHKMTLVTNNVKDFKRIRKLRVENWTE